MPFINRLSEHQTILIIAAFVFICGVILLFTGIADTSRPTITLLGIAFTLFGGATIRASILDERDRKVQDS